MTSTTDREPLADLDTIEAELAAYGGLGDRPRLVALNKVDLPDGRLVADEVRPLLERRGLQVLEVSAVTHEGLRELGFAMASLVRSHRESEASPVVPRVIITPPAVDDSGFEVVLESDPRTGEAVYRVLGSRPTRWVRQTDFSNDEAVGYLADRLARLGVEEELLRMGAAAGCTVAIGPEDNAVVFDWEPTIAAGGHAARGPRGTDRRLEER